MNKILFDQLNIDGYYKSKFCDYTETYFGEILVRKRKDKAKIILIENEVGKLKPVGILKLLENKTFLGINDYTTNLEYLEIEKTRLYLIDKDIENKLEYYTTFKNWNYYKLNGDLNLSLTKERYLNFYGKEPRLKTELEIEIDKINSARVNRLK